jgi:hypothetical protein
MIFMVFEIIDHVECYHGYKGDEKPLSFIYQNRQWQIIDIIDRWYEGGMDYRQPIKNYFKVVSKEGKIFLLCFNPKLNSWSVQIEKIKGKRKNILNKDNERDINDEE